MRTMRPTHDCSPFLASLIRNFQQHITKEHTEQEKSVSFLPANRLCFCHKSQINYDPYDIFKPYNISVQHLRQNDIFKAIYQCSASKARYPLLVNCWGLLYKFTYCVCWWCWSLSGDVTHGAFVPCCICAITSSEKSTDIICFVKTLETQEAHQPYIAALQLHMDRKTIQWRELEARWWKKDPFH